MRYCFDAALKQETTFERLQTLDFDRTRKSMSVLCSTSPSMAAYFGGATSNEKVSNDKEACVDEKLAGDKHMLLLVKGAPEALLDRCVCICKRL